MMYYGQIQPGISQVTFARLQHRSNLHQYNASRENEAKSAGQATPPQNEPLGACSGHTDEFLHG